MENNNEEIKIRGLKDFAYWNEYSQKQNLKDLIALQGVNEDWTLYKENDILINYLEKMFFICYTKGKICYNSYYPDGGYIIRKPDAIYAAFNTGLKTIDDKDIYIIFEKNEGHKLEWKFKEFAVDGERKDGENILDQITTISSKDLGIDKSTFDNFDLKNDKIIDNLTIYNHCKNRTNRIPFYDECFVKTIVVFATNC